WRTDGRGRSSALPVEGLGLPGVIGPEDLMSGRRPPDGSTVVVYDDDGYYMASALAELLAIEGFDVSYVASASRVADWSVRTTEQARVHGRLHELGIRIVLNHTLIRVQDGEARLVHTYTGEVLTLACQSMVPVTSREPQDKLWQELSAGAHEIRKLVRIGDCRAPGLIATAVYDGHRAARELFDVELKDPARRERVAL
ncbi:MAG: NADH:flavin oxidoreductase, partial [Anderseniella sp.]|nr:NADH:flavin oxidoreductase [Anderseniella sp.]